jgi:hypothetical protein
MLGVKPALGTYVNQLRAVGGRGSALPSAHLPLCCRGAAGLFCPLRHRRTGRFVCLWRRHGLLSSKHDCRIGGLCCAVLRSPFPASKFRVGAAAFAMSCFSCGSNEASFALFLACIAIASRSHGLLGISATATLLRNEKNRGGDPACTGSQLGRTMLLPQVGSSGPPGAKGPHRDAIQWPKSPLPATGLGAPGAHRDCQRARCRDCQ